MKILIDVQGGQSESRYRGIGRYTMSLVEGVLRNAGNHEIWILVNGRLIEGAIKVRQSLRDYLSDDRVRTFDYPWPVAAAGGLDLNKIGFAESVRNFCINRINPDVILVCSLFEGYVDDAIVSIDGPMAEKTACILYDLIPLSDPKKYLPTTNQKKYYDRKLESLVRAKRLLAISESAAREAQSHLKIDSDRVVTISSAVGDEFTAAHVSETRKTQLFQKYGLRGQFVLYVPGGFDPRKNFERLIEAYALQSNEIKNTYQLVIASRVNEDERVALESCAKKNRLNVEQLLLTGYVPDDELIDLYRLTALFVFPSLHEGFGLPLLEAMSCGSAAIGSNTTSIPEVIGLEEALFDPSSVNSIASKLGQALTDENFRTKLVKHALTHNKNFSWDITAQRTIDALELMHAANHKTGASEKASFQKQKLAFLSPMPPDRSGISDYSAILLPSLSLYYDITVVTQSGCKLDHKELNTFDVKDVVWFEANADKFERVIYQFGNSPFHSHMFGLAKTVPGVVVLHDFYLSAVRAYEEIVAGQRGFWNEPLCKSHGWTALIKQADLGLDYAKITFPVNLDVLQSSRGLIVHSDHSRELLQRFYGRSSLGKPLETIPLVRKSVQVSLSEKRAAKEALGFPDGAIVFVSFGFLDESKLNDKLLDAWERSGIAQRPNAYLMFVGECPGSDYGLMLSRRIDESVFGKRVKITGWVDNDNYQLYLEAADIGVQLRQGSRGETSAAVLDCMNYGLATLVNNHGSMAFLPDHGVLKIPDKFSTDELARELLRVSNDREFALNLGAQAQQYISEFHVPSVCASLYKEAIEASYAQQNIDDFVSEHIHELKFEDEELRQLANALDIADVPCPRHKRLMVDVTSIVNHDLGTGIERVVKAQLLALIQEPPNSWIVMPVYYRADHQAFYEANQFAARFFAISSPVGDKPVDARAGDVYYGPDYSTAAVHEAAANGQLAIWKKNGIKISYLIHDLLPVTHPEFFPEGAKETHDLWLANISTWADQVICISQAVADDYREWLDTKGFENTPKISVVTHGADFSSASPTKGLPDNASQILQQINSRKTFLMVGTIEPRKGYLEVLNTFESLWSKGVEVNLVIVGREGWTQLDDSKRRTIPETIAKIQKSAYLNDKLFWLPGISDEYLEEIYKCSDCLIAASEGEGFGLPLIEAALHGLPVIARNIPVFREIGNESICYFSNDSCNSLTKAVMQYLNDELKCSTVVTKTWRENSAELSAVLGVTL